ncbi:FoF1 ATP synthase subunit gamma [Photobacterium rosenbergii]|uniref:FoF1 ATP synthase subunit gamma n=1 Tax=Photobacterium rosenbergii TaxID=294936 RepID=A0ABU3ZEF9_9GAMM|nr:FoF1 ATP synthase subunit gamma [Photobacterium rosenbergii]MDV5168313.1 FoF1 ATP synthase subunit gamma [Photobacterium rosenbergii]
MTQRQELQHQLHSINEVIGVLNAMKMLAYMENHKLSTFLDTQHRVVDVIAEVADDFLCFHPETQPEDIIATPVYLIIGSERGFCGNFNQELVAHIEATVKTAAKTRPALIIVGRKLYNLVQDDVDVHAKMTGPNVVEEVPSVLEQTVQVIVKLQQQQPLVSLYSVYHCGDQGIVTKQLLPPFQSPPRQPPHFSYPPELNLAPKDFLLNVAEQYLFAALHELFYTSLIEENRSRTMHLEGAVKHLEHAVDELTQQCNVLRQEEIIEEIEVILLNAGGFED